MELVKVQIIDFKSIINEKISIQSNQLCLVGKNESGKSSVIQAISYLNILDTELSTNHLNKSSVNYPNGLPLIIGDFKLTKKGYAILYKLLLEFIPDSEIKQIPKESDGCILQLKRWGNGLSNISISIIEFEKFGFEVSKNIKEIAKFYNSFFEELYPSIEYYEGEELLIEPATIDELKGNDKKFETFRRLLIIGGCKDFNDLSSGDINFTSTYLSNVETKLNSVLKRHYKQDESINIRIAPAFGDRLNLIIRDNSEKSFSINERSPGFQYYFSFLVNKLYLNQINKHKNTVIILDEPGNNLHPKGAKDLLKSFDEISEVSKIIYTTHNPFLAVRNCIDSLVFVNKSPVNGTKIIKKSYLNKYQILRKELGIMLNDSFLIGDINLVVEGITEKLAFHRLFQFEKYRELEWLNIYNSDGVNNIPQAVNYLGKNNLKLSGIVILDSDKEANEIKKNKAYKKNINEPDWEEIEINSVFADQKHRTFEDLFPQDIYVNAFNTYCKSLQHLEKFSKDYINYVIEKKIEPPIINKLVAHFNKFLPENSESTITKQDVIRQLLDDVDLLPEKEQFSIFSNTFKLVDKIKIAFKKIEKYADN